MPDKQLRQLLIKMLCEPNAHLMLKEIADGIPAKHYGTKPDGFSHSPWQLLEHLRLAQEDILKFSIDPDYESPDWPDGYWPENESPPENRAWKNSVESFLSDLEDMVGLIEDESLDLHKPFEHGDGQTLLREAILLIKHNSYHLGQLMMLRKYLNQM